MTDFNNILPPPKGLEKIMAEKPCQGNHPEEMTGNKYICPVCGKSLVGHFETCPVCGWSNDIVQEQEPDMEYGDNRMSLNQAREAYKKGKEIY